MGSRHEGRNGRERKGNEGGGKGRNRGGEEGGDGERGRGGGGGPGEMGSGVWWGLSLEMGRTAAVLDRFCAKRRLLAAPK